MLMAHGTPVASHGASLMTSVGIVAGEILLYLDRQRSTTLQQLRRELPWSSQAITMAVGALIRGRLAHGIEQSGAVIIRRPDLEDRRAKITDRGVQP